MKVQTKILLLIFFVFVFFIVSLLGFLLFREKQNELIIKEKKQSQKLLIESVIKYITKNLAETVNDYAIGDDIVKFVNTSNEEWAGKNLLYILKFYHIDAVWVYNDQSELIYHTNKIVGYKNIIINIPPNMLNKIKQSSSYNFFMPLHNNFMQVCGSTIHTRHDINRIETSKGYILMAKAWDHNYRDEMSRLTGTRIMMKKDPSVFLESDNTDYINTFPIIAYNGAKVTELIFIRDNPFLKQYNNISRNLLLIFICFACIIIVLLTYTFRKLVSVPLGKIFKSLNTENIKLLTLTNTNDEFGKIAELIRNFYIQKQSLALQIDENVQKTKALEISEHNFRSFIEQSSDGIIIFDSTGSIIEANKSVSILLQTNSDNLINHKIWDLQYSFLLINDQNEDSYQAIQSLLLSALNAKDISALEQKNDIQIHLPDGTIKYINQTTFPIHAGDRFLVGAIMNDITKLKEAKLKITSALNKEMELNKLKNHFISTVSHEFRTPMTIIYSNLQLIEILKDNPTDTAKCFSRVYTAIKQMTHLLDEVNLMNKDFAGRLLFNPQEIIFKEFCLQVAEDAASLNKKINIDIHYDIPFEKIIVDPVLVQYIIINLLSNAIKFSREGETVIFSVTQSEQNLILQFEDNGIGIPTDDLPRIFEPFHRANNAENIKGTGLGMSIVKRSLELHNGSINVNSVVGKGTVIMVNIPFEIISKKHIT